MGYTIIFHPEAAKEIFRLSGEMKERIKKAISERLLTEPTIYGKPLRATLKGYWKLLVGDYRIVFSFLDNEILIYAVCHRREVYDNVHTRLPS